MRNKKTNIRSIFARRVGGWNSLKIQNANVLLNRWLKFSAVGATGIIVQTVMLAFFLRVFGLHYLIATALAVEMSVLHNFLWHRKWTWADRKQSRPLMILLRFNLTSGMMSLAGNLALMTVFVGKFGLNAYAANMATIALCSLINFALSDRFVFVS
ncbi:MAG TPA: GtrA family protein [Blastocatellia bacterium]|nr:GtrA family protein [Blastocatellia bacterium]